MSVITSPTTRGRLHLSAPDDWELSDRWILLFIVFMPVWMVVWCVWQIVLLGLFVWRAVR